MGMISCSCNCRCTIFAIIVSAILGVLAAFLQITAVITVTPVFLWVILGIAVVYLAGLVVAALSSSCAEARRCECDTLNTVLAGILGTILFSLILLAVGITATSVISAIFVGLAVGFFFLIVTATACLIRHILRCA